MVPPKSHNPQARGSTASEATVPGATGLHPIPKHDPRISLGCGNVGTDEQFPILDDVLDSGVDRDRGDDVQSVGHVS